MTMIDIIEKKKKGKELTSEEIGFFIDGVTNRLIPDYQISALLMAIVLKGMSDDEMTTLTLAMANSGEKNDLSFIDGIAVDKHSSGGVGDKCTPIVLPLVATFGVESVKLSGRGLGITGGTIDKFESIEGFSTSIAIEDFPSKIRDCGMVISGQTPDLAPADKVLYALRDVTATVDSIPLIASSIMSKKIAGGAKAIILDVKCGSGAFMKTKEDAMKLAQAMMSIGKLAKRDVRCIVSDMDQPLGNNCGNVLEMQEVHFTLSGSGPEDLVCISSIIAAHMVDMAGKANGMSFEELVNECKNRLNNGMALEKYKDLILSQGGCISSTGGPVYVDVPFEVFSISAPCDGYISRVDASLIGKACVTVGSGRLTKEDKIDYGAGVVLRKKIGDRVSRGDTLCSIYVGRSIEADDEKVDTAASYALDAYEICDIPVEKGPIIISTLV